MRCTPARSEPPASWWPPRTRSCLGWRRRNPCSRRRSICVRGVEVDPLALADILVSGGYERQDPVDEHGEFSVRGGILDVFPAGEAAPVRVEFIGDTIESIRRFDPGTQRSIETLDQFQIVPVREPEDADGAAAGPRHTVFDYLRASKALRVALSEPDDVRGQVEKVDRAGGRVASRSASPTRRRLAASAGRRSS